ncbi:MAG: ABC transporter permease [Hyphomicrobiales bacterium]|uniref:ABC transporter permease n=1 Tax=Rhabdaerophilum calidifontis TaxID=2604328 RepID=UPI001238A8FE|nr:ABC transporter permease [Rhabdaerophilum calidifontis]MCA1951544.1 ABC transporter permease [Hyphomicrobiales bacterium]
MMRALRHPSFLVGAVLSALIVALALVSLVWTPADPGRMNILARLRPPSAEFWLGTDQFGRDIASMLMVGARNALTVGLVAVGIGLVLGLALGLLAARADGTILDAAIMRLLDFVFAFPIVLSAILIVTLLGPGLVEAVVAIGLFNVPVFARLARGAALQVMRRDYIRAARLAGAGPARILLRHVVPNIAGLMIVQASVQFAVAILAEASLSYLGLGTQPPAPSWGRMLSDAQTFMARQPFLAIFPGAAIALAVLAFNLLGDGLRDLLDPRLRERGA